MLLDFSFDQWVTTFSFACTMSFICGWIADRIMGYAGFGVLGNWLLLLIGLYVGLFTYNQLGYDLSWNPLTTILVAFGAGTGMLIAMAGVKAVTNT